MDIRELKTYTLVKDDNKVLYAAWLLVAIAIILGVVFADRPLQYFNFYYLLLLLVIPLYNLFRKRTCPTCDTAMKRSYYALMPRYYYCEKCRNKIHVEMIVVG